MNGSQYIQANTGQLNARARFVAESFLTPVRPDLPVITSTKLTHSSLIERARTAFVYIATLRISEQRQLCEADHGQGPSSLGCKHAWAWKKLRSKLSIRPAMNTNTNFKYLAVHTVHSDASNMSEAYGLLDWLILSQASHAHWN